MFQLLFHVMFHLLFRVMFHLCFISSGNCFMICFMQCFIFVSSRVVIVSCYVSCNVSSCVGIVSTYRNLVSSFLLFHHREELSALKISFFYGALNKAYKTNFLLNKTKF